MNMTKDLIDQILRDIGLEKIELEAEEIKRKALSEDGDSKKS
ncbi:hypothetical protein [Desulfoscipio gibsoniae]|uniref:Uncharacterized protein n=1 Tax=Desulfoscipio gibsoniae DSM 7213 TaxID=767817 RepID=R4KMD3_9FIRM|nr:hypothetical protein [Desulfoscipio gibsoniae]AGL02717.1 hypothetical protein Desgi_3373 [Desulfoscipio gibsoniae DSM 7213]